MINKKKQYKNKINNRILNDTQAISKKHELVIINQLKKLGNFSNSSIYLNQKKSSYIKTCSTNKNLVKHSGRFASKIDTLSNSKNKLPPLNMWNYFFTSNSINLLFSIDDFLFEFSKKQPQRRKIGMFQQQLIEKKKLCQFYGNLSKKQLVNYISQCESYQGYFSKNFFSILERRLDVFLYRSKLVKNISTARQLISHKKILVNNKILNIASYQVNPGDIISIKKKHNKIVSPIIQTNVFNKIDHKNDVFNVFYKKKNAKKKKQINNFILNKNLSKNKNLENFSGINTRKITSNIQNNNDSFEKVLMMFYCFYNEKISKKNNKNLNFYDTSNLLEHKKTSNSKIQKVLQNINIEKKNQNQFVLLKKYIGFLVSKINRRAFLKIHQNYSVNGLIKNVIFDQSRMNFLIKPLYLFSTSNDSYDIFNVSNKLDYKIDVFNVFYNIDYRINVFLKKKQINNFILNTGNEKNKQNNSSSKQNQSNFFNCSLNIDNQKIKQKTKKDIDNYKQQPRNIVTQFKFKSLVTKQAQYFLLMLREKNYLSFNRTPFLQNKIDKKGSYLFYKKQLVLLLNPQLKNKFDKSVLKDLNSLVKDFNLDNTRSAKKPNSLLKFEKTKLDNQYFFYNTLFQMYSFFMSINKTNAFFILKLKKQTNKKRIYSISGKSTQLSKTLRFSSIKPMHIEVDYSMSTAILLYSPQRLNFPFYIDIDFILRCF